MSSYDRARELLAALDSDVQAERPRYYQATVLACVQCGHRFGIVNERAATQIANRASACKCGGRVKIVGYHARLEPLSRKATSNG